VKIIGSIIGCVLFISFCAFEVWRVLSSEGSKGFGEWMWVCFYVFFGILCVAGTIKAFQRRRSLGILKKRGQTNQFAGTANFATDLMVFMELWSHP